MTLELPLLNAELDAFAPQDDLKKLAARGIRGELLFPVPCVLKVNPRLLGYYRLLLGFSQKEFYNKGKLGRFSAMEEKGRLRTELKPELGDLCRAFAAECSLLLGSLGLERLSMELLDDLTLLTLGPQLRGSINTRIGKLANEAVFGLIQSLVAHAVTAQTASSLEITNSSGRQVKVAFSADPDISVVESLSSGSGRNLVAIEIKGGGDRSNIWNRLGEAEKSHQSAKQRGFIEFWTIHNLDSLDLQKAKEKSPTTHQFYALPELLIPNSAARIRFRDHLSSLLGITSGEG